MAKIFFTSDLHFGHNRDFIIEPRGFASIEAHDRTLIANWNKVVSPEDDVYILGDLMLGDNAHGANCVRRLNGHLHLVRGNHDTDARWDFYSKNLPNMELLGWAHLMQVPHDCYTLYLTHWPALTANGRKKTLRREVINLYGHTHQGNSINKNLPLGYHVGVDSNNNTPILLDDIIKAVEYNYDKANF